MYLDNSLVDLLGGSSPYPTVSPPSSLVSSVADSTNLEVGFAGQSFQVYDLTRFLDCVSTSFIIPPTTPGETTPNKATPSQTTPGETTPSRTTPGETTHSGPPPLAISPRPSVKQKSQP
ncbi:hypothetical protein F2Q69_00013030 [Brassica cretica]|uniref:Uncharacterized protein n=1 Tax=Brassica cretica TaxID=69181 RepID=A0A8S9QY54_BRACR|nr:hypothetical protein F2Q69_00013030 [Brassica cretica]